MTDKQPITEDDFSLHINHAENRKIYTLKFEGDEIKQQILDGQKALEELPKLKVKIDDLTNQAFDVIEIENQKLKTELAELLTNYSQDKLEIHDLKAEIEELKRQLQK